MFFFFFLGYFKRSIKEKLASKQWREKENKSKNGTKLKKGKKIDAVVAVPPSSFFPERERVL